MRRLTFGYEQDVCGVCCIFWSKGRHLMQLSGWCFGKKYLMFLYSFFWSDAVSHVLILGILIGEKSPLLLRLCNNTLCSFLISIQLLLTKHVSVLCVHRLYLGVQSRVLERRPATHRFPECEFHSLLHMTSSALVFPFSVYINKIKHCSPTCLWTPALA